MLHKPGKRPRPAAPTVAAADRGRHAGPTRASDLLSPDDVERLIDGACSLLADTGCAFEPGTEAIALFESAGCAVAADGAVRVPAALVREAIATTAKSARLWDRAGERYLELDAAHSWFMSGMTAIRCYDLGTGEPRDSTAEDLAAITRVADALPNIDAACVACKNVARSDIYGEIEEFAILIANTAKPLEYLCENVESFETAIEMACAVRGSRQALEDKPYFLQIVTPLPLTFWRTHVDQILLGARSGVPLSIGTLPIGGASAPITMAGCMVNSLATDFAAMVLAQLARPGCFAIGSSDVRFMEPSTGGMGNFPHTWLADIAIHQVRRHLGLPSFTGVGGRSVARRFNQDAVWEISATFMQAFFSRPATLDYCGLIDNGISYSMHALCLCDELAGMLRTMWQGLAVNADTMALDLARAVGPRGNYLAQVHTAKHCRDQQWPARYLGTHIPLSMGLQPNRELFERIDADLRRMLAEHRPAPLDAALVAELAGIQARFASRHPPAATGLQQPCRS